MVCTWIKASERLTCHLSVMEKPSSKNFSQPTKSIKLFCTIFYCTVTKMLNLTLRLEWMWQQRLMWKNSFWNWMIPLAAPITFSEVDRIRDREKGNKVYPSWEDSENVFLMFQKLLVQKTNKLVKILNVNQPWIFVLKIQSEVKVTKRTEWNIHYGSSFTICTSIH